MKLKYQILAFGLLLMLSINTYAQNKDKRAIEHQTMFGLCVSPMMSGDFIRKNNIDYTSDTINYSINLQRSWSFGAELRHYFTYRFAVVTGIMFTQRNMGANYSSQYKVPSRTKIDTTFSRDLKFMAYEIPIHALGYVRLTDHLYMSIAGGFNLNFYPSHIKTDNVYVQRVGTKIGSKAWQFFQLGYTLNWGWEFRTNDIGTFYLGASYQARADKMARVGFYEKTAIHRADYDASIRGDYFSINLKYYFPIQATKKHRELFK